MNRGLWCCLSVRQRDGGGGGCGGWGHHVILGCDGLLWFRSSLQWEKL